LVFFDLSVVVLEAFKAPNLGHFVGSHLPGSHLLRSHLLKSQVLGSQALRRSTEGSRLTDRAVAAVLAVAADSLQLPVTVAVVALLSEQLFFSTEAVVALALEQQDCACTAFKPKNKRPNKIKNV
jgi:hypothetical protein